MPPLERILLRRPDQFVGDRRSALSIAAAADVGQTGDCGTDISILTETRLFNMKIPKIKDVFGGTVSIVLACCCWRRRLRSDTDQRWVLPQLSLWVGGLVFVIAWSHTAIEYCMREIDHVVVDAAVAVAVERMWINDNDNAVVWIAGWCCGAFCAIRAFEK